MSSPKMLKSMSNGEIVLRLYNPETDHVGVLSLFRDIYMKESNIFRAFVLDKSEAPNAHLEFEKFIKAILKENISVIAHHLPSDQIAGLALNMIHLRPEPGRLNLYEELRETICSKEMRNMCDFHILQDKELNLFDRFNTDCVFECKYLATYPDFRRKGIAHNLVECSVELARNVSPRTSDLEGKNPTLVYGKFSSKYSARIGEKLGFVLVESTPINELEIDGTPISSRVPHQHLHRIFSVLQI